jgi:hypothetical protein
MLHYSLLLLLAAGVNKIIKAEIILFNQDELIVSVTRLVSKNKINKRE